MRRAAIGVAAAIGYSLISLACWTGRDLIIQDHLRQARRNLTDHITDRRPA